MTVRRVAVLASACLAGVILVGCASMDPPATSAIASAIADPGRPAEDTKRDADRKPAEIVAFAGVKPGQKIGELFPGGGYYTRILSKVVGPAGKVYMLTPTNFQPRLQKSADALTAALPNTVALFQPGDSPTTPEKVDVVWTTDNYHDYRNPGFGAVDMAKFDKAVFDDLKPGGVFLIEDYEAAPGVAATATGTLHRIESATVKQEVEAAGFVFVRQSDVLANPADDHKLKIFDPAVRGHADQYVLLFRKPK
jgi:predicted methyltransferase